MERIARLVAHPDYIRYCSETERLERKRIYCKHDMEHFLSVARIAALLNWEEGEGVAKEQIYAAALVHDIGRFQQYLDGTPHELESARLAEPLLRDAGYAPAEREEILTAVALHRKGGGVGLSDLLFRADKLSRPCYACPAEPSCNWDAAKKNRNILY